MPFASAGTRTSAPIGFLSGQKRFTNERLTRATGAVDAESLLVKSRPSSSAVPIVRKYPGVAVLNETVNGVSRGGSGRSGKVMFTGLKFPLKGSDPTRLADSIPGSAETRATTSLWNWV